VPISGIGSWITTIDEFVAHWTAVNAFLGLTPFKLSGAYTLAMFQAERTALVAAITDVQAKDNLRQNAAGVRDIQRAVVRPRILQFGPVVRGLLPNSRHIQGIPRTPDFTNGAGVWRDRMDDMNNLWAAVNTNSPAVVGFTPPLVLSGAYPQATFATDRTALDTAYTAISATEIDASSSRKVPDAAFAPLYQRMKQYRLAVASALPVGHALASSIPSLSPPPGSTPPAVNLSGIWDDGIGKGVLTFSESTIPNLDFYSVRYHPGPKYKASEEQTIGQVFAPDLTFETDFGLVASGSVAWFKVYVVTTEANEKGSNAVKVTRT
jgi:hypothetical protein